LSAESNGSEPVQRCRYTNEHIEHTTTSHITSTSHLALDPHVETYRSALLRLHDSQVANPRKAANVLGSGVAVPGDLDCRYGIGAAGRWNPLPCQRILNARLRSKTIDIFGCSVACCREYRTCTSTTSRVSRYPVIRCGHLYRPTGRCCRRIDSLAHRLWRSPRLGGGPIHWLLVSPINRMLRWPMHRLLRSPSRRLLRSPTHRLLRIPTHLLWRSPGRCLWRVQRNGLSNRSKLWL